LRPYLETLRESGRKLFLATNSLWDYTHVIMNYLLGGKVGSQRDEEWLEHFDVVICGEVSFPPVGTITVHLVNVYMLSDTQKYE
jgi:hypothetical protein